MLYFLAEWMEFEGIFNLVRYQTFRAGATLLTALFIGLLIGPRFINLLRVRQGKGQPIREDGPQSHLAKRGTPVLVLDENTRVSHGSRAICFAKRTLEIADRRGFAEPLLSKGIEWSHGRVFHGDN